MLDLKPIKERLRQATAGPWRYDGMHDEITTRTPTYEWIIASECRYVPTDEPIAYDEWGHHNHADFAFIAHARTDIPALIAEVERLRGALLCNEESEKHHRGLDS